MNEALAEIQRLLQDRRPSGAGTRTESRKAATKLERICGCFFDLALTIQVRR